MRQGQSSRRMCSGTTPPWVHFKLYPNAFRIHVIVSIDSKALEMTLVRACTRGAAGGASLSGSSDLVRTLGHFNGARSGKTYFRNRHCRSFRS